jgi:hypothetical protein
MKTIINMMLILKKGYSGIFEMMGYNVAKARIAVKTHHINSRLSCNFLDCDIVKLKQKKPSMV